MKEVTMTGLTNEQVQQRIEEGKINVNENPNTRSYKQIVRENVLTFFNFLNLALMIMVLLVGSYKNSMFMGIIVINTVIGIIQEVRAKKTLDKLAILTESKAVVLREGKKWSISTEKLVLDDILFQEALSHPERPAVRLSTLARIITHLRLPARRRNLNVITQNFVIP